MYWLVPSRPSVQASNQFRHPFRPHHAAGFARNPNRAACVKLSELCFRPEPLDSNSIDSATDENCELGCRRLPIVFQPFRPCFPWAVSAASQDPVHLAQLLQYVQSL